MQEYIEAISFRHYLLKRKVIEWKEAEWYVCGLNGEQILGREQSDEGKEDVEMTDVVSTQTTEGSTTEGEKKEEQKKELKGIQLSKEDYILGLFDMTGEMMRFAITSVATTPLSQLLNTADTTSGDVKGTSTPQCLLRDLRSLRSLFECMDMGFSAFGKDAEKKLGVMQDSVVKVEYAFYGMVVRGSERPEGWVAEVDAAENE